MKRPESPCLDCKDRHESCHADCEKYIQYTKALDEYRETVKANRLKEYVGSITDRTRYGRRIRKKGE